MITAPERAGGVPAVANSVSTTSPSVVAAAVADLLRAMKVMMPISGRHRHVRDHRPSRAPLSGEFIGCVLQSAEDAVGQGQREFLRQLLANGSHHFWRSRYQGIDDGLCG